MHSNTGIEDYEVTLTAGGFLLQLSAHVAMKRAVSAPCSDISMSIVCRLEVARGCLFAVELSERPPKRWGSIGSSTGSGGGGALSAALSTGEEFVRPRSSLLADAVAGVPASKAANQSGTFDGALSSLRIVATTAKPKEKFEHKFIACEQDFT
eukprot:IDg11107t1